jgi:serine phosphatase RsbU (regulator of sigma subunit)
VHYVSACAAGQVVRILVADVSGHGAKVGEAADGLRRLMRRLVNDHDQRRLVRNLNREFAAAAAKATATVAAPFRFATAVALTFDSRTRRLLACNAGHPPPLWYRAADRSWTLLQSPTPGDDAGNVPVGVVPGSISSSSNWNSPRATWCSATPTS